MNAPEDKVLNRIRKMVDLANNLAATEGERDTALQMAHNLMTKYQIDMAFVDKKIREREDPRGRFISEGWNMPWCKQIRMAIGKLFMCHYFVGRKINATRGTHHFVGRESNATTAILMSDWIIKSLLREGTKRYGHNLMPETRSFATGCAVMLHHRVDELRVKAQEEVAHSTGRSLMLIAIEEQEDEANGDYITDVLGITLVTKKSRRTKHVQRAWADGYEFGGTINLSTQLKGDKPDNKKLS